VFVGYVSCSRGALVESLMVTGFRCGVRRALFGVVF